MIDRLSDVEAQLRQIDERLTDLSRRMDRLEHRRATSTHAASPVEAAVAPGVAAALPLDTDLTGWVSLLGRTFVILGGAYLLRALTESDRLPDTAGIALGLLYAIAWLALAELTRNRGPLARAFYGLAFLLVGLPLVWEASARFHVLDPMTSATALVGVSVLGLGVAWHRDIRSLAVVATVGTIVTMLALAFNTGHPLPYAAPALLLAIGGWWLGELRHWPSLGWVAALALDLLLVGLVARAVSVPPLESPLVVLAVLGLFVAMFLGSFAALTLRQRRVSAFEALQTGVVLAVGVGGAATVSEGISSSAVLAVGAVSLTLGVAAYAMPYAAAPARSHAGAALYYFTTVGMALVLLGVVGLLQGAALDLCLAGLAVVAAAFAGARLHPLWLVHCAVLAFSAAAASGLIGGLLALWRPGAAAWPVVGATAWVAAVAAAAGLLVPRRRDDAGRETIVATIARVVLLMIVAAAAASLTLVIVGSALFGAAPAAGPLASLKTVVVSFAAVVMMAARRRLGREFGWIAGTALVLGSVKLVIEDLWISAPSTLFVALASYGVGLILTSRLAKRQTLQAAAAAP